MWLQILFNGLLGILPLAASAVIGSAIATRFRFNEVLELAVIVVALGLLGYLGFLLSWLGYLLDTELVLLVFRIALFVFLCILVYRYRVPKQIFNLVTLCGLTSLVAMATALCRGIADKDQGIQHTVAVRYWNSVDNKIPGMFANGLARKQTLRPEILDGWQSSDRPPIATGLIRIFSPFTHSQQPDFFILAASSSVIILSVVLLVRVIWNRRDMEIGISVATYLSPGIFVNAVYTWPKLIAAALSVVAIVLLFRATVRKEIATNVIYVSSTAMVLAILAHGSSVYALPPFVLLFLFSLNGRRALFLAIPFTILSYLPWFFYQRFWDPPGNRLLYWHLAGRPQGSEKSVPSAILTSYQNLDLNQLIVNKLQNFVALLFPVDGNPAVSGYSGLFGPARQLFSESVVGSIGLLGWIGLLVWALSTMRKLRGIEAKFFCLLLSSAISFCMIQFGDSFSTRTGLVLSPMWLSVALATFAFASLILYLRANPKLIVSLSIANVVFLGPLLPTAAAAGWDLELWDIGTCCLLATCTLALVVFANSLISQAIQDPRSKERPRLHADLA